MTKRVLLIVLDSCGCGGAPDAAQYGDAGADTIGHTARAVGGLRLPHLESLGLGRLTSVEGVSAVATPRGAFGRMQERSAGKDTTTGHWEIAGLITTQPFRVFPDGFPAEFIEAFERETRRKTLGNKPASGTVILDELGAEHVKTGHWIVYTSADSVFQIAAHEEVIPLDELYRACTIARRLCDPLYVGRVIARPFVGKPGSFKRTYHRRDFGMPPHEPTILDALKREQKPVIGVGKIGDIFCERGLSESIHTEGNADGLAKTKARFETLDSGFMFVNLIDFDSLYGHRRDPQGFARALEAFDAVLPELLDLITPNDLLIITADHGNDPTHSGSDHTREHVPLLVYGPPMAKGKNLGTRNGFIDIAATIAEAFGIAPFPRGTSFYRDVT